MHYSDLALTFSKQAGDSTNYYSVLAKQGELLFRRNPKRAKEYLLKAYRYFPLLRPNLAALLSYTYSNLNKQDSAKYYLQIALSDTHASKYKVIKYYAGAYVAKQEGNKDKAFEFYEKAYTLRDSTFNESIRSQLYQIDKQYDLTKKEAENAALKIDNRNKVIEIGLLVILILVGMVIFLILSSRYKKKQAEQKAEKKMMEYALQVKQAENNQKKELLLSKLQQRIENTLQFNHLQLGLLQQDKLDDFIKEISAQSILSQSDWQYYIREVNHLFDNKIVILQETNPQLTESDIRVITLICLRVDIADCCNLLKMTKNAMYHRRKIIKERIGIDKDIDLEAWILQTIEEDLISNEQVANN